MIIWSNFITLLIISRLSLIISLHIQRLNTWRQTENILFVFCWRIWVHFICFIDAPIWSGWNLRNLLNVPFWQIKTFTRVLSWHLFCSFLLTQPSLLFACLLLFSFILALFRAATFFCVFIFKVFLVIVIIDLGQFFSFTNCW